MKKNLNKILLEAVNRGIKLALDDFDDLELTGQLTLIIKDQNKTKEYMDLMNNYVVDLGLPSGTLWCKYNLGCDYELLNNHPEKSCNQNWYGLYYSWYKVPSLTDLDLGLNISNNYKFQVPTKEQFNELLKYTTNTTTSYKINYRKNLYGNITYADIYGLEFTSTINKNKLFFPAAGYIPYSSRGGGGYASCAVYENDYCYYWSSDFEESEFNMRNGYSPDYAWCICSEHKKTIDQLISCPMNSKYSIRPVIKL